MNAGQCSFCGQTGPCNFGCEGAHEGTREYHIAEVETGTLHVLAKSLPDGSEFEAVYSPILGSGRVGAWPSPAAEMAEMHVPGVLTCAMCSFRLVKTTLNVATGSAYANNEPDQCPNCRVPMWRVSWEAEAKEAYSVAESQMERALSAEKARDRLATALKSAVAHLEHMAAWIGRDNRGYSFEALGEDMPDIRAALQLKDGQ